MEMDYSEYKTMFKVNEDITVRRSFGKRKDFFKGRIIAVTNFLIAIKDDNTGNKESFMYSDFYSKYVTLVGAKQ